MSKLVSIDEAARTLAVSSFTIRRLLKNQALRAVRVGRRVLLPESEVSRVLNEGCGHIVAGKSTEEEDRKDEQHTKCEPR